MRQGILTGRYPAAALMVISALIPYLALSAALPALTPVIARQLHIGSQEMSLGAGMANAAYAFGTVLSVQLAQHLPQRRMMVLYAAVLVVGSVLTAGAPDGGVFIAGRVLQGLCTSLLLIAAAPPLVIGFSLEKLRLTAVIMNLCIFGAVALGPTIGGIQAAAHGWRVLFWSVAGVSVLAFALSILTFEDSPPADRSAPWDPIALSLAATGAVAAFYGASELLTHRFLDAMTFWPLLGGLATIVFLIVNQYRSRRPLLTIRTMLTSTMPVAGIVLALFAAAASVSATELTWAELSPRYSSLHLGLLYLPEFGGALLTALALGVVFNRRSLHYLPLAGMLFLAAGIGVFRIELPPSEGLTLLGSGLTGIGLGATVAPALFVAGFSLRSNNLQRVFAIVELLRAVAAFMIAPIFAHFAVTVAGSRAAGTGIALWIGLGLALAGGAIAALLYLVGGARPQKPDLERFMSGEAPAWYSPPLLAALRLPRHARGLADEAAGS